MKTHTAVSSPNQNLNSGRRWPSLAVAGRRWPSLAVAGRRWPSLAVAGRRWPSLAVAGLACSLALAFAPQAFAATTTNANNPGDANWDIAGTWSDHVPYSSTTAFTISNGAIVTKDDDGAVSLANNAAVDIGTTSAGTLNISAGSLTLGGGTSEFRLSTDTGGVGEVNVSGTGALSVAGYLRLGFKADTTSSLNLDGGSITAPILFVATSTNSVSAMNITGGVFTGARFEIGRGANSKGSVLLASGGSFVSTGATTIGGSSGAGSTATFLMTGGVYTGSAASSIVIANSTNAANGTLTIEGGALTVNRLYMGNAAIAGSNATLNISGGTLTILDRIYAGSDTAIIGAGGTTSLNFTGDSVTNITRMLALANGAASTSGVGVNVLIADRAEVNAGGLYLRANSSITFRVDNADFAGVLKIGTDTIQQNGQGKFIIDLSGFDFSGGTGVFNKTLVTASLANANLSLLTNTPWDFFFGTGLTAVDLGLENFGAYWTDTNGIAEYVLSFDYAVIPEPATGAALLGLAALALLLLRRRARP